MEGERGDDDDDDDVHRHFYPAGPGDFQRLQYGDGMGKGYINPPFLPFNIFSSSHTLLRGKGGTKNKPQKVSWLWKSCVGFWEKVYVDVICFAVVKEL